MKRHILTLVFILLSCCLGAHNTSNVARIRVLSPIWNDSPSFEDECLRIHFYLDISEILGITITNKTTDRFYIEWENARYFGGKIVFGNDSKISMMNPKADEMVAGNGGMSTSHGGVLCQDWISQSNIQNPYLKNVDQKATLLIPIRFNDGHTKDYFIEIEVRHVNTSDTASLQGGMTQKQVKKIAGEPDKIVDENTITKWYYNHNCIVSFENKKVVEIQRIDDNQSPKFSPMNIPKLELPSLL